MYNLTFDSRELEDHVRTLFADTPADELTPTDTPDAGAAVAGSATERKARASATYRTRPAPRPSPRARYTGRQK